MQNEINYDIGLPKASLGQVPSSMICSYLNQFTEFHYDDGDNFYYITIIIIIQSLSVFSLLLWLSSSYCYHYHDFFNSLSLWCVLWLSSQFVVMILLSYTLSREYRVVRNQYSRLLFTILSWWWLNIWYEPMRWPLLGLVTCINSAFYHDMQISGPDSNSPPIRLPDS